MRKPFKHLAALATATATVLVSGLIGAQSATAEGNPMYQNDEYQYMSAHKCADQTEEYRFRFYYNSNNQGAWVNIGNHVPDLARLAIGQDQFPALTFCDKGKGAHQRVANNAGSAYNWYQQYCATVHYNSWYRGPSERVAPGYVHNLGPTKNNNKSVSFEGC
ncbi:hypothetical protein ACFCYH_12050 [Streptomyces sp. NPDC056400]|uniref:hypothetical protein n=1 Tax=unclassified Streptomyces TaxID=2593676 RepID=UPI0035D9D3D7